jgi:hypothetical protein
VSQGQTWVNGDGYVVVRVGGLLRYQHRLVWEAANGTPVPPGHVVHHREGDKTNNDAANLEVMPKGDRCREHNR